MTEHSRVLMPHCLRTWERTARDAPASPANHTYPEPAGRSYDATASGRTLGITPLPVPTRQSTVTSAVTGSGVVDAEDGVVRVLVYVNVPTTRPGVAPKVFQNRVTMKMVKDGDRWLVDKVDTY